MPYKKQYTKAQKAAFAKMMTAKRAKMVYKPKPQYIPRKQYIKVPKSNESIGSKIGGTIGKFVGHGLQQIVKAVTGFGDYAIENNSLMEGGMSPPEIINSTNKGGFIVRHREYIADINASTNFSLLAMDINPGLASSFPWLSQIAEGFEQYNFRGLIYEFKSMSSDAVLSSSTSSALGTVIMATQYNSALPNFPDKKTMENYDFANSSKPSCSFLHPVECKKSETPVNYQYVRTGAVPSGQDQRLYDLGNFQIATQGMQAASGVAGELWATFEIEFFKPKLVSGIGYNLNTDKYKLGGTINPANPLGSGSIIQAGSEIGTTLTSTTITFPSWITDGTYMLVWQVYGTATSVTPPAITVSSNISSLNLWRNDSQNALTNGGGDGIAVSVYIVYTFKITNFLSSGTVITFGTAGTFPTAVQNGDLLITQINGAIST